MNFISSIWQSHIMEWSIFLRAADRSESTIKLRCHQIQRLAVSFPDGPAIISPGDLIAWLGARDWSADTRRSHRAAVTGFFAWMTSTGQLAVNPADKLPSSPAKPGRPRPAKESVIEDALAAADARDALMIRLGAYAGLRACEIATLHTSRIFQDLDGWTATVIGKGSRWRDVPLARRLAFDLRARPAGWIFPGRINGHLSAAYVSKRLSRALGKNTTGHQLRHRFASRAYTGERDIRAVQELLGHASPATTAVYTAIPDHALRRAVDAAS